MRNNICLMICAYVLYTLIYSFFINCYNFIVVIYPGMRLQRTVILPLTADDSDISVFWCTVLPRTRLKWHFISLYPFANNFRYLFCKNCIHFKSRKVKFQLH